LVNFEVGTTHQKLRSLICSVYKPENMTNCFWNNTSVFFRNKFRALRVVGAHHGVSLAAAGLAVSKNGSVVALNNAFYKTKCTLIVDFLLLRFIAINHVEGKSS